MQVSDDCKVLRHVNGEAAVTGAGLMAIKRRILRASPCGEDPRDPRPVADEGCMAPDLAKFVHGDWYGVR